MNGKRIIAVFYVLGIGVLLAGFLGCVSTPGITPAPEVALESEDTVYISPDSSPGVKDVFESPLKVTMGEGTVPQEMTVTVKDREGREIFSYKESIEEGGVEPLSDPKSISLPEKIKWSGVYNSGFVVPDGEYRIEVSIKDNLDQLGTSKAKNIVVDNTPPTAKVSLPYKTFSPNNDGNKDALFIHQDTSKENTWTGEIREEDGKVVAEWSWEEIPPKSFQWNGSVSSDEKAPDGTYTYVLQATDRSGNTVQKKVENIVLSTETYEFTLTSEYKGFSPNDDGNRDVMPIDVNLEDSSQVASWQYSVVNSEGQEVAGRSGKEDVPSKIEFSGKEGNQVLPEGEYTARMQVAYKNGNTNSDRTRPFVLDITPPKAQVEAEYSVFSPNGDGNKETITIQQTTVGPAEWEGSIVSVEGDTMPLNVTWSENPPESIVWEGKNKEDENSPDGAYKYVLRGVDIGGNRVSAETDSFEKDTSEIPSLALKPNHRYFSPNEDGVKDILIFQTGVETKEGLEEYTFSVLNLSGERMYSISNEAPLPETISWKGVDNEGNPVSNGTYQGKIKVFYKNGNAPVVKTEKVVLDRQKPTININIDYKWFSPDGDDRKDTITIEQVSSEEDRWKGKIVSEGGEEVFTKEWEGEARNFTWDGTSNEGKLLPDGEYKYRVFTEDKAGNSIEKEIENIRLDTRKPTVNINPASSGFSPNDDGRQDQLSLNLFIEYPEAVADWSVQITDTDGNSIKSYSGESQESIPDTLVWYGKTDADTNAETGEYNARLTVRYVKGNKPMNQTDELFVLDREDPEIRVSVSPTPFTPDGDGNNDIVEIDIETSDNRELDNWRLTVIDPAGNDFISFDGKEAVDKVISWDGESENGELVQSARDYTVRGTVKDVYGNITTTSETLPVGILVEQEKDGGYKIRITSIHFVPNKADYLNLEDPEKVEENKETLDRLAEILKNYKDHSILIEGHAVMIYYYDEELAEEEQQETLIPLSRDRARVIKEALVERGINEERMEIEGLGGKEPVVPHGDMENRWKNRRVEFELMKKQ